MGSKEVLKTLLYSDIFDYPLTKDEIWKYLIGENPLAIGKKSFENALEQLQKEKKISFDRNFYCLLSRKKIIALRLKRQKESEKKLNNAKKIMKFFTHIPLIQFIGISGALALQNCDKDDDIDIFIITSKGRLWLTRFILIIFLKITGRYRGYNSKDFSDKICLNMLMSDNALTLPKNKQNFYTAHEIVQLMPVLDRDDTYLKFLAANEWIGKFLPNTVKRIKNQESRIKNGNPLFIIRYSLFIFELIAKYTQLLSINKRKTTETISDDFLAFHPFDYQGKILGEYERRLKQYAI